MKKRFLKLISIFLTGMILAGCSPSTELRVAWKTGDDSPKKFSNIGILALLKSNEARIDVETGVDKFGRILVKGMIQGDVLK